MEARDEIGLVAGCFNSPGCWKAAEEMRSAPLSRCSKSAQCHSYRIAVRFDRVDNLFCIPAPHRRHNRETALAAVCDDEFISSSESFNRQFQFPQPVALVGIDACLVEDKIRPEIVEDLRKVLTEDAKIFFVADVVGQINIERTNLFSCRKVFLAVHREAKDAWIVTEDCRGSVALMHVAINHGDAFSEPVALESARGNCDVVEHAVAFAVVGESVMRATRQIRCDAVPQGVSRSDDRSLYCRARTANQSF